MSQAYLFKEKQNAKPWHRILLTEACIPSPASSLDFPQELWGHFRNYTVTEFKKKKKASPDRVRKAGGRQVWQWHSSIQVQISRLLNSAGQTLTRKTSPLQWCEPLVCGKEFKPRVLFKLAGRQAGMCVLVNRHSFLTHYPLAPAPPSQGLRPLF